MKSDINKYKHDEFLLNHPNELISLNKWQKTVNLLASMYHAPASFLVQYTPKGFQVTISSEQVSNPYPAGIVIEPDVNIFCRKIVESKKPLYVSNALMDPCWDTNPEVHNDGFRSYFGVPILWPDGEPFGTFCVMDYEVTDYQGPYLELIHQLKDILESDLQLVEAFSELQQLAVTDPLTKVNNRRGFYSIANQRINLAKKNDNRLALFYIDIDRFKTINDKHGHNIGDKVLVSVAETLKDNIRSYDVVGRLGGDEFGVLLTIKEYSEIEAFENTVSQCRLSEELCVDFSLTLGHVEIDPSRDFEDMLTEADKMMLSRKSSH